MKDIYSPSHTASDNGSQSFAPIPLSGSPAPDASSVELAGSPDDLSDGFYGSYGSAVKSVDEEPIPMPDFSVPEIDLPDSISTSDDGDEFSPVLEFSSEKPAEPETPFIMPEEDLVIPDMPAPVSDPTRITKKSMGYETTVKIKNARNAEKNEERINEPIKKDALPNFTTRQREFNGIASGTAHVSGGLPELKDNQMYVAVTPKELRRLKSRRFRGLGVFCTLCLAVIAAFCIWNYVNSFTDPIIGRWKGDISSVALGIDEISALDQDVISSTWEFSGSGALYVNLVLNDTPVSLSGSYVKLNDEKGEQYISMTLKNPMDNNDYDIAMYYTVTGRILQLNDMDGVGAEIDLTKE